MKIENINWEEIQLFYNDNKTWRDIKCNFNLSDGIISKAKKLGLFKSRSKSEANIISNKIKPRKLSEETKKKISESRKKYLQENPDKVPYKLNHSSKESYPEKYFTEVFKNEGIVVVKSFYIGLYELDFCIPDKKIDIEIDGSQHYYDEKIVESDKRRNKFLEDDGWDIIRINWSEYQKLNFFEKKEYILNLNNYINNLIDVKPIIDFIDNKRKCICGNKISKKSNLCQTCYRLQSRKFDRPSIDKLKEDIEKLGYSGTGRKYGVSDNSIRKWLKIYEKN
jgi:very-short-patch-repair endonuclease